MCNLINEANRRGIPTILVSDMYFSEEQITDILASKDFNLSSVDRIYMSSDYKCNKAIGTIWDIVFDDYSYCQHSDLLHIGDNYKSDYQIPKSYNINCIYYDTISTNLSTFFNYESTFIKQPNSISSIRKLAVKSGLEKNNVTDEIGGSILGPLLTFFIDWVINISIKEGKSTIYSFTRNLSLLSHFLNNAASKRKINISFKSISVSRESTWLASLIEWNEDSCDILLKVIYLK